MTTQTDPKDFPLLTCCKGKEVEVAHDMPDCATIIECLGCGRMVGMLNEAEARKAWWHVVHVALLTPDGGRELKG